LHTMSKTIGYIALLVLLIVVVYNTAMGRTIISSFTFAVALAAAVVPEGLPTIVSVALSISAGKLAKQNALVKRLTSVESLGLLQ